MMRKALAMLAILLAGCLGTPAAEPPEPSATRESLEPHVVVATMDTGINPYHDIFQRATLSDAMLELFRDAVSGDLPARVNLTQTGTLDQRIAADQSFWSGVEMGRLYYFEGTRVLAILQPDQNQAHQVSGGGDQTITPTAYHGTGVAAAVSQANPDAIIVMIDGYSQEGEAWMAAQPWIDVYTMSYKGPVGDPYTDRYLYGLGTSPHTRTLWNRGGMSFGAGGNTPLLSLGSETSGPPWVVLVGGSNDPGCSELMAALAPEIVADYDFEVAGDYTSTNGTMRFGGTSGATPTIAGVVSRVILEARRAWESTEGTVEGTLALGPDGQKLTNQQLREGLWAIASYFPTDAACDSPETGEIPVGPAPWLQMGWGNIVVNDWMRLYNVTVGGEPLPARSLEVEAYMQAHYAARQAFWSAVPPPS